MVGMATVTAGSTSRMCPNCGYYLQSNDLYDDNVWGYFVRTTEPKTEEFKLSHKEEMRQQRNFDPRKFKGK